MRIIWLFALAAVAEGTQYFWADADDGDKVMANLIEFRQYCSTYSDRTVQTACRASIDACLDESGAEAQKSCFIEVINCAFGPMTGQQRASCFGKAPSLAKSKAPKPASSRSTPMIKPQPQRPPRQTISPYVQPPTILRPTPTKPEDIKITTPATTNELSLQIVRQEMAEAFAAAIALAGETHKKDGTYSIVLSRIACRQAKAGLISEANANFTEAIKALEAVETLGVTNQNKYFDSVNAVLADLKNSGLGDGIFPHLQRMVDMGNASAVIDTSAPPMFLAAVAMAEIGKKEESITALKLTVKKMEKETRPEWISYFINNAAIRINDAGFENEDVVELLRLLNPLAAKIVAGADRLTGADRISVKLKASYAYSTLGYYMAKAGNIDEAIALFGETISAAKMWKDAAFSSKNPKVKTSRDGDLARFASFIEDRIKGSLPADRSASLLGNLASLSK